MRTSARLVSDWRTHAAELRGSGLASFYAEHPSEDDRGFALEARGRLDLSRRTNIEALASHQVDKESRAVRDAPGNARERGDIETNRVAAAFNHRFNRLSLQLRGAITQVDFAPVPIAAGGLISNEERDYTQRDLALRAGWAMSSKVAVFAETAANDRDYRTAPVDGILRSSQGERYRAGLSFAAWDTTLRGELSVGWGRQRPNDARLGDIEGAIVDANLAWRATTLTSFLLTANSDFIDTTAAGSAGALSHQVGLEAQHAFRRHIIGLAGVRYVTSPYNGIYLHEQALTGELGLDYYLGRDAILYGRYQHVVFDTTAPNGDYTADILRVGVRVRQ